MAAQVSGIGLAPLLQRQIMPPVVLRLGFACQMGMLRSKLVVE